MVTKNLKFKEKTSKIKIKICGITNLEDALVAVKSGADALGFVFYKKSPRYISPKKAARIIACLSKRIKKVGVFVNAQEKAIRQTARLCSLDLLQFHGEETPEFCRRFKNYKIIKAFGVKSKPDLKKAFNYKVFAFLFDAYSPVKKGGTGRRFNWRLLKGLATLKNPVFLSGGLNEKNVRQAIKIVRPDWVDASSCLESAPGKKDARKIKEFIEKARGGVR